MIRSFFFAAMLICFAACGANDHHPDPSAADVQSPEDSLLQEVMDGHDVAMGKTRKIAGFTEKIQQKIDSLKRAGPAADISLQSDLERLKADLMAADVHMNQWMHDFNLDSAENDAKLRIQYLTSEKLKVNNIKDEILSALARADSLLAR